MIKITQNSNNSICVDIRGLYVHVYLGEDDVPVVSIQSEDLDSAHVTSNHAIPKIKVRINEALVHSPAIAEEEDEE